MKLYGIYDNWYRTLEYVSTTFVINTYKHVYIWDVSDDSFISQCYMQMEYLQSRTSWELRKFNQFNQDI